jgi:hypothetical protein
VEFALEEDVKGKDTAQDEFGFNPCFGGSYSGSL